MASEDKMSIKFKSEKDYNNLLLHASEVNNNEDFKFAIENGADVNYHNNFKQTPLMFAMLNANSNMVKALVELGADLGAVDSNRNNLYHYALGLNYKMFGNDMKVNERAKFVKLIANANKCDANLVSSEEISPLHLASFYGVKDAMVALLDKGANPNALDAKGRTPLFMCYKGGFSINEDILFNYGADVNTNSWQKFSTLYYVLSSNFDNKTKNQIADKLIDMGASIEGMQLEYLTNEQIAKGIHEMAEKLIKNKLVKNLEAVNDTAYRTFIQQTDKTALFEYLLGKGDYKNAKLVIQMGVDLDCQLKKSGETRLMRAVKQNNAKLVKFLVENGTDINVRDKRNISATQFAIELGFKQMADYLLNKGGRIYTDKETFEKLVEVMGEEYRQKLKSQSIVSLGNSIKKTGTFAKDDGISR